jgi:hypothetical protein
MKSRHWVWRKTDLQRRSPVKTPAPLAKLPLPPQPFQ